MGDIKKRRKKYSTPMHPWQKTRIDEEIVLKKEYGLTNKKEIWKVSSKLKVFKERAKYLVAKDTPQIDLETTQLLTKLKNLNLLQEGASLADILDLNIKDVMERRLQTLVFRKGLARSIKQARQFITHNHITVSGTKMTVPSYLVSIEEENQLAFSPSSSLNDEEHPERAVEKKAAEVPKQKTEKKEKEDKSVDKKKGSADKKEKKETADKKQAAEHKPSKDKPVEDKKTEEDKSTDKKDDKE